MIPPELMTLIRELIDLAKKHQAEILKQRGQIKQLERDVEYLMAANAATNTRLAGIADRERRLEAEKMYGIRR